MLITSIIFSKNRPLQLDLCLKSIKQNFPQSTQNIVIHNNSVEFGKAHLQQKKEHLDVEFWQQTESLFCDVWDAVNEAKNDYVCFFVDDCIVYNKLFLEKINLDNLEKDVVSCISLRLGINICERSHDGHVFPDKPTTYGFSECGKWMIVNRTANQYGSYWSYNLSVDGHIFKKSDMKDMVFELWKISQFKNLKQTPNEFEGALQRFWTITPAAIVCPSQSAVVNSPNNKVQDSHQENRSGDIFDYDEKLLLDKYESGARIHLNKIEFPAVKCPHTEIDILKGLE